MGEMAEAMLEGLFCASCGELFDDMLADGAEVPGFPRYCPSCAEHFPEFKDDWALSLEERKPFPCGICQRRFTTEHGRREHRKTKHPDRKQQS